jgi:hypothetical protein
VKAQAAHGHSVGRCLRQAWPAMAGYSPVWAAQTPGRAAWVTRCPQAGAQYVMLRAWPPVRQGIRNGSCFGGSHGRDSLGRHIV